MGSISSGIGGSRRHLIPDRVDAHWVLGSREDLGRMTRLEVASEVDAGCRLPGLPPPSPRTHSHTRHAPQPTPTWATRLARRGVSQTVARRRSVSQHTIALIRCRVWRHGNISQRADADKTYLKPRSWTAAGT